MEFKDAKQIIGATHKHFAPLTDLMLEILVMLEQTYGEKLLKHEREEGMLRIQIEELSKDLEAADKNMDALGHNAEVYREECETLTKEKLALEKELEQLKAPKKKRGRPKKAETFKTELNDLCEDFGIHDLAVELANMEGE